MMKRYIFCLFALFVTTTACEKEQAGDTPAETTADSTSAESKAIGLEGEVTREKVQDFLERWFEAYSERDWDTLDDNFTPHAEVVIHDGAITNRVSPAVWKSQHSRDIATKSKRKDGKVVMAPEVIEFESFDGGAFIRANVTSRYEERALPEKTWEFVLRENAGKNRVALVFRREDRTGAESAESAPARADGTLMIEGAMLLRPQPTTDAERGYRTLLDESGLAELWVDKTKLPTEWQQLDKADVEFFDRSGERCESAVTGFRYYTRLELPVWIEKSLATKVDGKLTAREAGELAWKMAGRNGRVLVASLDPAGFESCENPIWVRENDGDEYPTYPQQEVAKRDRVAMQKFAQLKGVAKIEREFDRLGDQTPWYQVGAKPIVKVFSNGDRTFVAASATAGTRCDDFVAGSFAIWEIKGQNWSLMTPADHEEGAFEPFYVADVDNDGSPEFYGEGVVVREIDGAFRIAEDVRPVSFQGGC